MKKRLHDKKAGIAILLALIAIALAEMIFRIANPMKELLNTSNMGEQVAVVVFATAILILTAMGKDRICYICYGAWIGYFVLDQMFELPGMITNLAANISNPVITFSIALRLITMLCIIAIGVLLVEYMNDGTIYNRAFNALCLITILLLVVSILTSAAGLVFAPSDGAEIILLKKQNVLIIFNNIYRLTMIFLFSFFAYDSAKLQLKKANLTK
jgi:hypothetical protein